MLKIFTLWGLSVTIATSAFAQPVITNSSTMPIVGFSDSIRLASGANVGPSGAGVTWDFSGLSTTTIGSFSVVSAASSPYSSTFPAANYVVQLSPVGGPGSVYEYYTVNSSGVYINASGYSASSTSNNYTPNSKLRIPFPFSYSNSVTDTFQKVGSSLDAYAITYDGYGTLKVPGATYNNVVRLKYEWIGGEIAYNWFTTSPLFYVATWSQSSGGQFNFLGKSLASTSVNGVPLNEVIVSVFPSPAQKVAALRIDGLKDYTNITFTVQDLSGRIVKTLPITSSVTTFQQNALPAGLYIYQLRQNRQVIANGKLSFE
jgi:hypothetical protein